MFIGEMSFFGDVCRRSRIVLFNLGFLVVFFEFYFCYGFFLENRDMYIRSWVKKRRFDRGYRK